MLKEQIPNLISTLDLFIDGKNEIVLQWMQFDAPRVILKHHDIDTNTFALVYADNVFDYFIDVIRGKTEIGDCPVMAKLLNYLKDRDVSADELFVICSHFRKSMLEYSYDIGVNTKALFDEITYVFDLNFAGVLKMYADRIYQKELELEKSVKLLNEYKNAIDESALVSKTDKEGMITYANDNLIKACGFSRQELVGKSHNIIRHPDMPVLFFKDLWNTIHAKKIFKGTIKNSKKNNDYFYVDSTIVPIVDPKNEIAEYMAIGYEVTKLIDARQQAVEADQSKDYFLSNMSHEIRTPLNAILGFVSLLMEENTSAKHKKYLKIIHNSGENLLTIINDILDFSKLRSGEFTIDPRAFNLHEELSHTLELFAPVANEKQITLLSFIDPNIPYELIADPLRMQQIVANFLSNAIKFTPHEGKIEVEAICPNDLLKIKVTDNGIGIAKDEQAKIFNAFSQTRDSTNTLYGGTGLGLSICLQLAKHMQGTIELESTPGKGSTFTLILPVKTGDESRLHMFDPTPFQQLRLGLLQIEKKESDKVALLRRYWKIFDLEVKQVDQPGENNYDLLFFVDSEIDEEMREKIVADKTPAIAIMGYFKDIYGSVKHIAPLYFPLYCAKLYNTFLEALQLTSNSDQLSAKRYKQRRFKGNVLVAEDNTANQELIKIVLQRYGIDYTVVAHGIEALDTFKKARFDMVLMDEQMPKMNGMEAMQKIIRYESEKGYTHTPIVALTANVIKGTRERGLLAGYDAFLGKPIIIKELENVFEQFLDEDIETEIAVSSNEKSSKIRGIDEAKLLKELMLEPDQLLMLLTVFLKKMDKLLPELHKAIETDDLDRIARLAHNIKGSSANFRIKSIQSLASTMENAATAKTGTFDYKQIFFELDKELKKITIEELSPS